MAWVEPKTNWSDSDRCNYADFNRIENNTGFMAEVVDMTTLDIKTDWDNSKYPFSDELNRIESNIETIRNHASLPVSMGYKTPRTWIACEPIGVDDLVRMEGNLQAVKHMNTLIAPSYKFANTFSCGEEDLV